MINLRELAESDLATTIEGETSLPVELVCSDGTVQSMSKNDPENHLSGQVLFDRAVEDPETGAEVIVRKPVVTLRRSSLDRIPMAGERWIVKIPETPSTSATLVSHRLERPPQGGGSIGTIRLYVVKIAQTKAAGPLI